MSLRSLRWRGCGQCWQSLASVSARVRKQGVFAGGGVRRQGRYLTADGRIEKRWRRAECRKADLATTGAMAVVLFMRGPGCADTVVFTHAKPSGIRRGLLARLTGIESAGVKDDGRLAARA